MIQSFACQGTQALFEGRSPRGFRAIERVAERKLQMLHRAVLLDDLRVPPGHRLEKLVGDREGQCSIRINGQWRVCFVWREGHARDDYDTARARVKLADVLPRIAQFEAVTP